MGCGCKHSLSGFGVAEPTPPSITKAAVIAFGLAGLLGVVGVMGLMAANKVSTPNQYRRRTRRSKKSRPPKPWMDDCVRGVEASGSAADPGAVCGSLWYRKMSNKQRAAAKRRSYGY